MGTPDFGRYVPYRRPPNSGEFGYDNAAAGWEIFWLEKWASDLED